MNRHSHSTEPIVHSAPMPRNARLVIGVGVIGGGLALAWLIGQFFPSGAGGAPAWRPQVVATFPHDPQAYCQGLAFDAGKLFEGTGRYGSSSLREVELETGKVLRRVDLTPDLFGEGITVWGDTIIQLTWKSEIAIVYDKRTLKELRRFRYSGQGWGLTHDGKRLIMSDGSSTLRFIDPDSFRQLGTLQVRERGRPISRLNELEYVEGEIYANLWYRDRIARISPGSGEVVGWIDLTDLYPARKRASDDDVLNGIAYDAAAKRLVVTGKNWPKMFQLQIEHK